MPLQRCTKNGKSGWKYGDSGHCYTGPGAKKKAIKQGIAIDGPDGFKKAEGVSYEQGEFEDALAEYRTDTAGAIAEYLDSGHE